MSKSSHRTCTCALAFLATACSPAPSAPRAEAVALHHAAAALHVLLQNGYTPDALARATTDVHTEYEIAKRDLSADASKKCDHAALASDSLRHVFDAMATLDASAMAGLRHDLENLGVVTNDQDWNETLRNMTFGVPSDSDSDTTTSSRAQVRQLNMNTIFNPARNAALKAAAECEQAT